MSFVVSPSKKQGGLPGDEITGINHSKFQDHNNNSKIVKNQHIRFEISEESDIEFDDKTEKKVVSEIEIDVEEARKNSQKSHNGSIYDFQSTQQTAAFGMLLTFEKIYPSVKKIPVLSTNYYYKNISIEFLKSRI